MFKNSLHCATLFECNAQLSKYAKPLVYRPLLRGLNKFTSVENVVELLPDRERMAFEVFGCLLQTDWLTSKK